MPIGIGAAMLIGSAASAGAGLASAKAQSNAAKKAQQQQQAATDKALAVQQQTNQPYMQLGQQAAARLGQMAANQQPYTQVFGSGAGAQGQPGQPMRGPGAMGGNQFQMSPQRPPQGPPQGMGLGQIGQGGMGQPQPMRPPQGQQGPGMGMPPQQAPMGRWLMPGGQTAQGPLNQAQMYESKGGRRIG
ncbi:MAG: hypothetical protein V4636_12440 [Pseudomonadota bacterium]